MQLNHAIFCGLVSQFSPSRTRAEGNVLGTVAEHEAGSHRQWEFPLALLYPPAIHHPPVIAKLRPLPSESEGRVEWVFK